MDAQQLTQVEALCETLYTGVPAKLEGSDHPITRPEAQQRLLSLQSNVEYIPQCQYILDNSNSQYARLVASNSLIELITLHWNSFTVPQRIDIRNYVLSYLGNNGPTLSDFLVLSLIKLVCRITRLGWFDDSAHRELTDEITKFLQATVDHCILGLKILVQLVDEMNIAPAGRTLTQHRRTSVSFRDVCLLKVFQLGLTTLKQLQSGSICKCVFFVYCENLGCCLWSRYPLLGPHSDSGAFWFCFSPFCCAGLSRMMYKRTQLPIVKSKRF